MIEVDDTMRRAYQERRRREVADLRRRELRLVAFCIFTAVALAGWWLFNLKAPL